ncbi:signal recognition particle protein [Pseudoflavonifractor sp. AF19-9AC]|uniref:signal recognition particle protein n=1 Tax=Pseudoflavonifractor sp. AF19-9AC TaxID=2292244 RepID=UPI000E51DCCA|nr:signal recognition particle protein [Pseudoflavonifractor sp. AF19-9AC]RHR05636.1 signal recognition particle protein [Pseudoflavonifractor sp. AF19-9AC]
MAFEGLSEKLSAAFKKLRGKGRLSEADVKEAMREIRLALLEADVSYKVVKQFIAQVTEKAVGADVLEALSPAQMIIKIVNQELTELMGGTSAKLTISPKPPTIVMMVGLQGAGKTTNVAKLAGFMKKQNGKRPLLVACDVYRPAAIKQLEVVGEQLDIPVFQMGQINPVDIAKASVEHALKHGNDIVFLDTAGRLHVDEELMDELRAIKAAVNPTEILLVVDAMIGQDAVNAAKAFDDALDISGVVLTKLDGDARGGAALSIKSVTGKPIKFVGMGEKLDQIEVFHPDRMASRILGMGDMLSLIEKAEQSFDQKKALELQEKLRKNKFTLTDFYEQMAQLKNMGSLSDIAGMIPGVKASDLEGATMDEKLLQRMEAIILSMTPYERENPSVLNSSRKKRIAAGSGTQVVDVNRLLKQFEMLQTMTKQFSGNKLPRNLRKMMGKKGGKGMFPGMGGGMGLPF